MYHLVMYSRKFFEDGAKGSIPSARVALPVVKNIYPFQSVVDVGCGVGSWASVARELGAEATGVDGNYVPREMLLIDKFIPHDLTKPFTSDEKFDLAMCIEVAEHLPPERADNLVGELCNLAPVVLFSAAIPGQGGTDHINEQWQDYWIDLFAKRGYSALGVIRKLWGCKDLAAIYQQNMFLMASGSALIHNPGLQAAKDSTDLTLSRIVHPDVFYNARVILRPEDVSLRIVVRAIPGSLMGTLKRKFKTR